jgi:hypothetical protein
VASFARHRDVRACSRVDSCMSRAVVRVVSCRPRAVSHSIACRHTSFACVVRTCGSRRRRDVRASGSCVIRVLSRACRACCSHALPHVVCMRRVCHLRVSLALPRVVSANLACRSRVSRDVCA